MLPYFHQPTLTIGRLHVTAFAVCAVAALIVARWVILRRARRFGITYEQIAPLYIAVIVAGLAGGIAAGLFTLSGLSSLGAVAGGLFGAVVWCWVQRYALLHATAMLDVLAFAAPLAGAIGRIGCTLAHDHRGLPSQGSLAFHFPEGGRYDLGFFDLLFLGALSILFAALGRKPKFPLFFVGLSGSAYGAFRIWRDTMDVASSFTAWATVCMIGVAALMFGATMEARAKHDTRGTGRSASGPAMASDSSAVKGLGPSR